MKVVGARIPRYDGVAHVTGRTTYVDDVSVPGTLWAKALRSPHHHAGITKLDTSKAESMPGVHAVITWKDVPLLEYGHLSALGIPADEPLLDELHAALSPRSQYQRFHGAKPRLTPAERRYLAATDGRDHVALVALDGCGEPVAVGRFVERNLGGSLAPFLAYLSESSDVSEAELRELEELVARLNADKRKAR